MPAVAGSRPRGRGRVLGVQMPSGTLPKNPIVPKRGPGGMLSPNGGGRPGVNPQGQGMMNPAGQGPARASRGRGSSKGVGGKGAGIGGAALPGPGGRQLAARVSSGAITQEQADRTMQQRRTLRKSLGPDWREKLSVGGKSFAQVNAGLKKNPGNAKLAALRKKLATNRSSLLENARSKGKGGGGGESAQ